MEPYYGPFRGRNPWQVRERWYLETRPERQNNWNVWVCWTAIDDDSRSLLDQKWYVSWWGIWQRPRKPYHTEIGGINLALPMYRMPIRAPPARAPAIDDQMMRQAPPHTLRVRP